MENVFGKILKTRPNTFVVFSPTGPRSSGVSPMAHSTTGLSYASGHFLPGRLSGYAHSSNSGNITFTGKFCSDPINGGKGSVEFIRMKTSPLSPGTENLMSIPDFIKLDRVNTATSSNIELSVYNTPLLTVESSTTPAIEHIAVNVDGMRVSFVVNGKTYYTTIPEEVQFPGANSVTVYAMGARLWGVAVRPETVPDEYCREIVELANSFPEPAEAEMPFNPTTFVYDYQLVNDPVTFNLEDLSYPEAPESPLMFNGSRMEDVEVEYTEGWLNIPDTSLLGNVLIEKSVVNPAIVGSEFDTPEIVDETDSEIDGHEAYSTIANQTDDVVEIQALNQLTNGSPERVLVFHPDSPIGYEELGRSMTLRFVPDVVTMDSTSSPDRDATLTSGGKFVGNPLLFRGGYVGSSTINPDANATLAEDLPVAYGMWAYLSGGVSKVLVTNGAFTLTVESTIALTKAGIGDVYVDGTLYTSGNLSSGWHHIAFIPDSTSNAAINVTPSPVDSVIVYTFSLFFEPTPSSYLGSVYRSYVNPLAIRPTTPDSLGISDAGPDIYSHEWSISSAD